MRQTHPIGLVGPTHDHYFVLHLPWSEPTLSFLCLDSYSREKAVDTTDRHVGHLESKIHLVINLAAILLGLV